MSENTSNPDRNLDEHSSMHHDAAGRPRDGRHDPPAIDRAMAGIDVPDAELRGGEEGDDPADTGERE